MPRTRRKGRTASYGGPPPNDSQAYRPPLRPKDICVGCIVWLPIKENQGPSIKCRKDGCCGNEELKDEGYNHPIVVLKIKQKKRSKVCGDLVLTIALVSRLSSISSAMKLMQADDLFQGHAAQALLSEEKRCSIFSIKYSNSGPKQQRDREGWYQAVGLGKGEDDEQEAVLYEDGPCLQSARLISKVIWFRTPRMPSLQDETESSKLRHAHGRAGSLARIFRSDRDSLRNSSIATSCSGGKPSSNCTSAIVSTTGCIRRSSSGCRELSQSVVGNSQCVCGAFDVDICCCCH